MSLTKTAFLFLLLITLSACSTSKSTATKKVPTDWNTYSDNKVSIKHPSDWEINKKQETLYLIIVSPRLNTLDEFSENVNLLIQDLSDYDLTLEGYVAMSIDEIKTILAGYQPILSERKKKGKTTYQKVMYTGNYGDFKLTFEQYYWVIEDKAYVLTLTCETAQFGNYQKIGEQIMESLEIK